MKLLYVANIRLPTEKAHGIQIMKMCEAFAKTGANVELVVTDRKTPIVEDPFEYYGINTRFPIVRLPVSDTAGWGKLGFLLESVVFALRARRYVRARLADMVFSRDELVLWIANGGSPRMVWESHDGRRNFPARRIAQAARLLIVTSAGQKNSYLQAGVLAQKILIAPNGISLKDFSTHETQEESRTRLGLPLNRRLAIYIGRLDGWKGVDTLLEASAGLPDDVGIVVIGGEPEQVAVLQAKYPNVMFLGYRPYRELAGNQQAADVLILPNTAREETSVRFTSPLKLFTYMASGVPIVASDLPSIREIIDEKSAFFFVPDDPASLARSILTALEDKDARKRAETARQKVQAYTWENRASLILKRFDERSV